MSITHEHVADAIRQLGLTYTATFQPRPQPGEKNPQLHWHVVITSAKGSMTVEYKEGMGHVKGYQSTFGRKTLHTQQLERLARKTCETGKVYKLTPDGMELCIGEQPPPTLEDVLYCVVSDADVMDARGFEEWARDLGYDADSRKAEAIYKACQQQTLDLLRVIGTDGLAQLREVYQDY